MKRSSVGKMSKAPMEEDMRVLGRVFDSMGSGIVIIEYKTSAGRQLRRVIRESSLKLLRAISFSEW